MTRQGSNGQSDLTSSSGRASGRHPGLGQPTDTRRLDDAAQNADPALRGLEVEDQLGDKRSKGVANGFDDSIDHDADEHYRGPNAAER